MKLVNFIALIPAVAGQTTLTVRYDVGYDDASRSLDDVSCSNGANGLETTHGWTTQGQIPHFPYIGASQMVSGWNSPDCGTCWALTYNGNTINVLAIDKAGSGFNIGLVAMNALTNGQAVQFGSVTATAAQVDVGHCGI